FKNLKESIDAFAPDINLFYNYDINNKKNDYGITISKTIPLADSRYVDAKLSQDNIELRKISENEEFARYAMLKK
ncbi:hypothetical protein, partial [Oceanivirga salmonicida]